MAIDVLSEHRVRRMVPKAFRHQFHYVQMDVKHLMLLHLAQLTQEQWGIAPTGVSHYHYSPPCETLSNAHHGHNPHFDGLTPVSKKAVRDLASLEQVLSTLQKSGLSSEHTLVTVENPRAKFMKLPVVRALARQTDWTLFERADHCVMASPADPGPITQKPTSWLVFSAQPPKSLPICRADCPFRIARRSRLHQNVICNRSTLARGQSVVRDPVARSRVPLGAYRKFWQHHSGTRPPDACACTACFLREFSANVGTAADHDKLATLGSEKIHDVRAELAEPVDAAICMRNLPEPILWHQCFGHIGKGRLNATLRHVHGIDCNKTGFRDPAFCRCCVMVKQQQRAAKREQAQRPSAAVPLGQVSIDLIEYRDRTHSLILTMSNAKYAVVFVDGCSRYKYVYPIAKKSDTLFAFKKFVQQVGKPQSILTDWGSEFDGQFDAYCTEQAIKTSRSCPY
jgi:hypothetical protein